MKKEGSKEIRGIGLHFGALCDPIIKQVRAQGFDMNKADADHFQKDAEAITRLRIRLSMSEKERDKLSKKLLKNIEKKLTSSPHQSKTSK